jgi:hypothetical protein
VFEIGSVTSLFGHKGGGGGHIYHNLVESNVNAVDAAVFEALLTLMITLRAVQGPLECRAFHVSLCHSG